MAYQTPGTPRFYICTLQWLKAQGLLSIANTSFEDVALQENLIGINPTDVKKLIFNPDAQNIYGANDVVRYNTTFPLGNIMSNDNNFAMALGHNFGSAESSFWVAEGTGDYSQGPITPLVNIEGSADTSTIDYDGFSIVTGNNAANMAENVIQFRFDYQGDVNVYNDLSLKIGSLLYGNYYDMPHSPNLNVKLSYEMDGVKTIQSKGGASLSNATHFGPPDWGDAGAWQLGGLSNLRTGRRVIDLSFSFISETDIFPVNASGSHAAYTNDGYYTDDDTNPTTGFNDIATTSEEGGTAGEFTSNILTGQDFFSQVWNRTMGGHLPMIVQMSNTNNNPDQFMLARFDQSSLEITQTAPLLYSISLKIRESW